METTKIYHYATILQFGSKRTYFILDSKNKYDNESDIIELFVSENKFSEDDADNSIGAVRLTESQYKKIMR